MLVVPVIFAEVSRVLEGVARLSMVSKHAAICCRFVGFPSSTMCCLGLGDFGFTSPISQGLLQNYKNPKS